MLILDSTVLIAALDSARTSHQASRSILSSGRTLAVTTQTMREALAVATRPQTANGLEIPFADAWKSLTAMRMACGRLLYENEKWWAAYAELAQQVQPTGRSLYDVGQIAFVRGAGPTAQLLTDDRGLVARYGKLVSVVTVQDT